VAPLIWHGWRRQGRAALQGPQARAQITTALAGVIGLAWFVVIAVLTQIGFSGNNRYLVLGSALVEICGAVAWGWTAQEVGNLVARLLARGRELGGGLLAQTGSVAAFAVVSVAFLTLPSWIGGNLIDIPRTHHAIVYQAKLREDVTKIVQENGGAAKLLRCGTVMTEGFQVPMVAWTLDVRTLRIEAPPAAGAPPGPAPNVILQTRAQTDATLLPIIQQWPQVHYTYVGHVRTFRLFEHCRG
jgi:hypothetical protein